MLQSTSIMIPPDLLLRAYRAGIFPMSDSRDDPEIYWVEPRLRAILPLDGFHCSRSLARTLRRGHFTVTCNEAFDAVIDACAAPREGAEDSWISQRIRESYRTLHQLGHAHSIETWITTQGPGGEPVRELVGGLYGVGFGKVFCGEHVQPPQRCLESGAGLAGGGAAHGRGDTARLPVFHAPPRLDGRGGNSQAEYLALLGKASRYPVVRSVSPARSSSAGAGATGSGAGAGAVGTLPAGFAALLAAAAAAAGSSSSPGNFIAQSFTQTS
jgi:leucyl/phenylalanyl-tRNA--protein transferase